MKKEYIRAIVYGGAPEELAKQYVEEHSELRFPTVEKLFDWYVVVAWVPAKTGGFQWGTERMVTEELQPAV